MAAQVNFAGLLIATAFGKGRATTDESTAGKRHCSEVSAIPERHKTHRQYRAIAKGLGCDTDSGELPGRSSLHAPYDGFAVRIEFGFAIGSQKLKEKLGMIGAQDKSRELSSQRFCFGLVIHRERVMRQSGRAHEFCEHECDEHWRLLAVSQEVSSSFDPTFLFGAFRVNSQAVPNPVRSDVPNFAPMACRNNR